jgi:hypothetical protein
VHDPLDPEYSILKQRLARRVRYEGVDPTKLDLVSITHLAERTITNVSARTNQNLLSGYSLSPDLLHMQDIEYLIEKSVDFKKANIAVITGVQVRSQPVLVLLGSGACSSRSATGALPARRSTTGPRSSRLRRELRRLSLSRPQRSLWSWTARRRSSTSRVSR